MLKLNLSYIFNLRGIKKSYSFLRKLGFSHDVAHRLGNQKVTGLKLYQMEKLCTALHCTPNDLLEWKDAGLGLDANHPLATLKRNEESLKTMEMLQKLPIEKMAQLKGLLDGLVKD